MLRKLKLLFFAAFAPTEIPSWFSPVIGLESPRMPVCPISISEEARAWLRDPCYDLVEVFDDDHRRAVAEQYQVDMERYYILCEDHKKHKEVLRYFSWRWTYAQSMADGVGKK